jgi:nucleoside 2-deoxyribosyltransferase
MKSIYLIGSLRNPEIPKIGNRLRAVGYDVFCDWHAAGPRADDEWKRYETERGHSYREALNGYAARHVFEFDKYHIDRCNIGVLVMPAGRSGHLELGYMLGQGKPGFVVIDTPDRWDVMYQFADGVFESVEEMICDMKQRRTK